MDNDRHGMLQRQGERLIEKLLVFCAALFIIAIALITIFIFAKGLPLLLKVGLGNFLLSTDWRPDDGVYGIGAMVVGTVVVTLGSMLWAVPLGVITAIFMAEIAPPRGRQNA